MPSLAEAQHKLVATINDGPGALIPGLFEGDEDRILLGLKVHANTISHARLVALEESFPLTRTEIGEAMFNALSRDFVETAAARACVTQTLGSQFPHYLERRGASRTVFDMAQVEWAWLESYHSVDARPMDLAAIGAMQEPSLLSLRICFHPATRLCPLSAAPSSLLGHFDQVAAILVVRPEAEVRLLGLDAATQAIAQICQKPVSIGNILAVASEQAGNDSPIEPILTLIGAGALVTME